MNSPTSSYENNKLVIFTLNCVEGFCFAMFCQLKPQIKEKAIAMLKEIKQIISLIKSNDASSEVYFITYYFPIVIILKNLRKI